MSNDVRQKSEENLAELQKQYRSIKEAFQDRDSMLKIYKKKFEEEQNKLTQIERKADTLEIEKKSLEKQNDIQRKQLLDKINQQTELISAEKDTREIWINRYEKEQKMHIKTHTDFMNLRGEMQEMTLKYENQRTIATSLDSIKLSLQNSHNDIVKNQIKVQSENETLKRKVSTKEKLLIAQEEENRKYIEQMRDQQNEIILGNERLIECHLMEYEELRSHSDVQYQNIVASEKLIVDQKHQLETMTLKKENFERLLKNKERDYDQLTEQFETQTMKLIEEQKNHQLQIVENQRLEEVIKDLKGQIEELETQIVGLKSKIEDLECKNADHELKEDEMKKQIEVLEEKLFNKKERWDVEIQVEFKTKTKGCQTHMPAKEHEIPGGVSSFGHISDNAEHFIDHQTVVSTTNMTNMMNQTGVSNAGVGVSVGQVVNRPRIQSAQRREGLGTGSTMQVSKDQGQEPAQERRTMLQRPTKSAANKYRQMIQGNAIVEEKDYSQDGGQNIMIGGFFQKPGTAAIGAGGNAGGANLTSNLIMGEELDSYYETRQPIGMQHHRNERRSAVRLKHKDQNNMSSGTLPMQKTTTHTVSHGAGVLLANMQYGSQGRLANLHDDQNLIREFNDSKTSTNLKSVYDMRVSHSNLAKMAQNNSKRQQSTSNKANKRKHLQSAITRSNRAQNNLVQNNFSQNFQPARVPGQGKSALSTKNNALVRTSSYVAENNNNMNNQQQQSNNYNVSQSGRMTYMSQTYLPQAKEISYTARPSGGFGSTRNSRAAIDNGIGVKGKGSIRTLIRLANTRALDEEDSDHPTNFE